MSHLQHMNDPQPASSFNGAMNNSQATIPPSSDSPQAPDWLLAQPFVSVPVPQSVIAASESELRSSTPIPPLIVSPRQKWNSRPSALTVTGTYSVATFMNFNRQQLEDLLRTYGGDPADFHQKQDLAEYLSKLEHEMQTAPMLASLLAKNVTQRSERAAPGDSPDNPASTPLQYLSAISDESASMTDQLEEGGYMIMCCVCASTAQHDQAVTVCSHCGHVICDKDCMEMD